MDHDLVPILPLGSDHDHQTTTNDMTTQDANRQIEDILKDNVQIQDMTEIQVTTLGRISDDLAQKYQIELNALGDRLLDLLALDSLTEISIGVTVVRSQSLALIEKIEKIRQIQIAHLKNTIAKL
jgi:hypothetical protein